MTIEKAIEKLIYARQNADEELDPDWCASLDMAIKALEQTEPEKCGDIGEISDGYHTFNQLYHQRAILFAAIVNQNKGISWKSYKHSDGKYCFDSNGEWFIVGVDTPEGPYTYHYSKEYWDYFDCQILECGKEWDGHTEDDVTRLLSLTSVKPEKCGDCISRQAAIDAFERFIHEFGIEDEPYNYGEMVLSAQNAPSVEPDGKDRKMVIYNLRCKDGGS